MATSLGSRVSRAVLFSGVNTIITRVVNVLMTAVTVRLVTPEEFGTYAVALTVFVVISGVSELGLATCLARQDVDPDEVGPTVATLALVTAGLLAAALYFGAGPLAAAFGAPEARDPLRILSLCVVMIGVFSITVGMITREFRQDAQLVATLVSFFPANGLLVWMALQGQGAEAFAWSRVLGQVVLGGTLMLFARTFYRPGFSWRHCKSVLAFSAPVAGASFIGFLLMNADYLFVGKLLGPATLGVYTLAYNVGSWASSAMGGVITTVAMPAFSHAGADPRALRNALSHACRLAALAAFPIAGFTVALAEPIVNVLYGDQYLAAIPVLEILAIYGGLFVIAMVLGNLLVGVGLSGRAFGIQLTWLAALMPAMAVGVKLGGVEGAALAHIIVLVLAVMPAYLVPISRKVPGVSGIIVRCSAAPLLLTVVAALVGRAASELVDVALARLMVGGLIASGTYLLLSWPLLRLLLPRGRWARVDGLDGLYMATIGRATAPVLARVAPMRPAPEADGSERAGRAAGDDASLDPGPESRDKQSS